MITPETRAAIKVGAIIRTREGYHAEVIEIIDHAAIRVRYGVGYTVRHRKVPGTRIVALLAVIEVDAVIATAEQMEVGGWG